MALEALVEDNGDVATMLLISPAGMYARYDAEWVILTDPELISHLDAVAVEDTALDLHDPHDQTGMSVKIGSMPRKPYEDFRVALNYSGDPGAAKAASMPTVAALVGSGTVPTIASARDMAEAVEFANGHPEV